MFTVYRNSNATKVDIADFDTKQEAVDFCDYYGWEVVDENCFVWDLTIEETAGSASDFCMISEK